MILNDEPAMGARLRTRPRVANRSSRGMKRTDAGASGRGVCERIIASSASLSEVAAATLVHAHTTNIRANKWPPCLLRARAAEASRRPSWFVSDEVGGATRTCLFVGMLSSAVVGGALQVLGRVVRATPRQWAQTETPVLQPRASATPTSVCVESVSYKLCVAIVCE